MCGGLGFLMTFPITLSPNPHIKALPWSDGTISRVFTQCHWMTVLLESSHGQPTGRCKATFFRQLLTLRNKVNKIWSVIKMTHNRNFPLSSIKQNATSLDQSWLGDCPLICLYKYNNRLETPMMILKGLIILLNLSFTQQWCSWLWCCLTAPETRI